MGPVNIPAKFEVHSFIRSWDNRGYSKNVGSSCILSRSIFCQIFWSPFVRTDHLNISAKFDVRSFTHSWDNRGYFKNLGSFWIRPRSLFSQIFKGILFAWTLWIYPPSLMFVALSVPEIIGGTSKIWGVRGFAHAPYSPEFLKGFCSHGPPEYIWQVWSA